MILRNGKVHRLEEGVPGVPRIRHLEFHQACDRFLLGRGLITAPSFRKSAWLFGRQTRRSK